MKTLKELVKELGLRPSSMELVTGRQGNYVIVYPNNQYSTYYEDYSATITTKISNGKVYEVLPND